MVSVTDEQPTTEKPRPKPPRRLGLSGKLLLLTIPLVMIAEVLIYVPVDRQFLDEPAERPAGGGQYRGAGAGCRPLRHGSGVAGAANPHSIGARAVAIKMGQQRRLLASADLPPAIDHDVDMRSMTVWSSIVDSFEMMLETGNQAIRVVGPAARRRPVHRGGDRRGAAAAGDVPVFPQPAAGLAGDRDPDRGAGLSRAAFPVRAADAAADREPGRLSRKSRKLGADHRAVSQRGDEIGVAERELSDMQRDLVSMLHQKSRLAALGLAVSKINHDLRNLLASSQLLSDQLASVPDPRVQRFAPKLMRSLERAIAFCQSTLSYGRAQEAAPDRRMMLIEPVVAEVRESAGLASDASITWISAIERGLTIDADPDQLFRVLLNLVRNAAQALESRPRSDAASMQIRITGRREGAVAIIEVSDTGPGMPPKTREHLFEAFQTSGRPGGSGLGLAIAAELVRAHGGDIHLVEGTIGATFRISIPDRPVELLSVRNERARA